MHVPVELGHGSRNLVCRILDLGHEVPARKHVISSLVRVVSNRERVVSNLERVVSNLVLVVSNLDHVMHGSLTWSRTSTEQFQTSTE